MLCIQSITNQQIKVNQIGTLTETIQAINLAHNNGYTPLMLAALEGHQEIVKLLLGKKDIQSISIVYSRTLVFLNIE